DAVALEAVVRRRGTAPSTMPDDTAADAAGAVAGAGGRVLLALPLGEVLRLGLISNRGMIVVGGAFAAPWQFDSLLPDDALDCGEAAARAFVGSHHPGVAESALVATAVVVAALALVRALSVVLALLQYQGFRLEEHGRRLTVERGLLTRLRTSAPRRRIQAWTLHEGLAHRLFGRRTLEVRSEEHTSE